MIQRNALPSRDLFGLSIAMDGNTLVVGTPGAQERRDSAVLCPGEVAISGGAAYVYTSVGDDWVQQAVLTPEDIKAGDRFGTSVDISGNVIVVGAPLGGVYVGKGGEEGHMETPQCMAGLAYVFVRQAETWRQEAVLAPLGLGSTTPHGYDFGGSVSICGTTVVVAAEQEPSDAGRPQVGRTGPLGFYRG